MIDITDLIDPHIHAAPEHIPRLLDDISLARQAREAGMAGILIKSHTTLTADRATIAASVVGGIQVWGGLVLNDATGGVNPATVENAITYGAREIWMPTLDAANHKRCHGQEPGGLSLENEELPGAIRQILDLIAAGDVILGTGHLSTPEILKLIPAARQQGVRKILITHPEAPFVDMPIDVQQELAALACRFERTWVFTTPALGEVLTADQLTQAIHEVGVESTVLASDMGQVGNPPPVEGFRAFITACSEAGFGQDQIRQMGADNIREWLD